MPHVRQKDLPFVGSSHHASAAVIEAGQVVTEIDSNGADIRATGPWLQLFGVVK